MARPKKKKADTAPQPAPSKEVGAQFDIVGPEERDGHLYMSRMDFLQAESIQAKSLCAIQAQSLVKMRLESLIRERETALKDFENKINSTQAEIAMISAERGRREQEAKAFWTMMGKSYGIDFAETPYDDVTGRILKLEDLVRRDEKE